MNKFASLYSKAEARDKMLKFVQFASRLLRTFAQDQLLLQRLNGLHSSVKTTRKMFRMGKSVIEIHAIHKIFTSKPRYDLLVLLQVLVRVAYCLFWLFDNLAVLGACKVVKWDGKDMNRVAMIAWFGAVVLSIVMLLIALIRNYSEETICLSKPLSSPQTSQITAIYSSRKGLFLNLQKNICDLFPSASGSQLSQRFIGFSPPERLCGLGGSVSALITLYQQYTTL